MGNNTSVPDDGAATIPLADAAAALEHYAAVPRNVEELEAILGLASSRNAREERAIEDERC